MRRAGLAARARWAGLDARVVPTHGFSWLDTDCELCGGCLAVCPTGAIYEKAAVGTPEAGLTKVRTTCPYCGVGCQLDLNVDPVTQRIVKVTSSRGYLPNDGELCVKGRFGTGFVHHPDRLTRPLVRGADGELHPASWDEAIRTAADVAGLPPIPPSGSVDDAYAMPLLAGDRVRYVGEPIAIVLADSLERATDAAELVVVDYEPLPAVVGFDAALAPDAEPLFPGTPGNVCHVLDDDPAASDTVTAW